MLTKKDLEAQFELSDNTVYKTLKACGLDTARQEYTEEEINDLFKPARRMIDEGQTLQQVTAWAKKKKREEGAEGVSSASHVDLNSAIRDEVEDYTRQTVKEAVKDMIDALPAMMMEALEEEARSGNIRAAFQKTRREFTGKSPPPRSPRLGLGGADDAIEVDATDVQ